MEAFICDECRMRLRRLAQLSSVLRQPPCVLSSQRCRVRVYEVARIGRRELETWTSRRLWLPSFLGSALRLESRGIFSWRERGVQGIQGRVGVVTFFSQQPHGDLDGLSLCALEWEHETV
jgi:hypothetical protein